jgi:protein phosphatase 2C family protein 2/3
MNPELRASEQIITAVPDVVCEPRSTLDEFVVIACDGIWDLLTNDQVINFVRQRMNTMPLSSIVTQLFNWAVSKNIGHDNMTCMIVNLNSKPEDAKEQQSG